MANISQIAPFTDSVVMDNDLTGDYANQLGVSGTHGQLTYVTTAPSSSLLVGATGYITTTGYLSAGTYTVAGTVSGTNGDSGLWAFNLTVTDKINATTSITPHTGNDATIAGVTGNGIEMKVPFQIDSATGGVAQLIDYGRIMSQHIKTILLTMPGERLMMYNYGSDVPQAVFSPIQSRTNILLADDIKTALATWEPSIRVLNVSIDSQVSAPNVLSVTVDYSVVPFRDQNTVTVVSGGVATQVSSS